jgi:hypothetical protein
MPGASRPHEDLMARPSRRAAVARAIRVGMLAGLVAGSLLLLHAMAPGAGADLHRSTLAIVAARKPSEGDAPQKVSPYVKATREQALAAKPEHRPNLRLSVRGAQKASSR